MNHQVFKTLEGFGNSKITIVEWGTPLLIRLGYPLTPNPDLIFLVPDNQFQEANDIATRNGLKLTGDDEFPTSYLSEFPKQGCRYAYGEPKSKCVLIPLSWSGIAEDELSTITTTGIPLPCTIWTVPMPAFCAAYLRIIMQERRGSTIRSMAIADLTNVIAYSIKEASEMEAAVNEIRGWKFGKDEDWHRDTLIQLVTGKQRYEELPSKGD
ncbi:hypothetical protein LY78DRAFT_744618 [Colletotrichum sublineola]|nr:hypothetical protein LY78DRAFT_744618 [Colletotrichum sublineola]